MIIAIIVCTLMCFIFNNKREAEAGCLLYAILAIVVSACIFITDIIGIDEKISILIAILVFMIYGAYCEYIENKKKKNTGEKYGYSIYCINNNVLYS